MTGNDLSCELDTQARIVVYEYREWYASEREIQARKERRVRAWGTWVALASVCLKKYESNNSMRSDFVHWSIVTPTISYEASRSGVLSIESTA